MRRTHAFGVIGLLAAMAVGPLQAAPQDAAPSPTGYAELLASLKTEIAAALPKIDEQKKAALQTARGMLKKSTAEAVAAQQALGRIQTAKALVEHAKGKWIGGAEKGIAQAETALKKATTEADRETARKDLAKWKANKEDGLKALKERQAAYDAVRQDERRLNEAVEKAQAALDQARNQELAAAKALLTEADAFLASEARDAALVKAALLVQAGPKGLSEFAAKGETQAALVKGLLADGPLMKEMLVAGGAEAGQYGRATEIYSTIRKTSSRAGEGHFHRLALAVALEHAVPVPQSHAGEKAGATDVVDPVKRYQHYEKAWLDGELDPAFKDFSTWEYRMIVDCDAPDEILSWGRQMLRNYRPDHVSNPDYGWRYSGIVRTDVQYGSQNVKDDLPSLHAYQNIIKNGGVCGRRAFFGRFILKSFGIPTWGVTQHKHAAVGRWTPKGWLVNLGAGFPFSWWDKEGAPRSGSDFLLETQARSVPQEHLKVLRAQWTSMALGEEAYNDRRRVEGGFWSRLAHDQARSIASKAVALGPVGEDLAEANESTERKEAEQARLAERTTVAEDDRTAATGPGGVILINAAGFTGKPPRGAAMKSFLGGLQVHCSGGFKADFAFEAPREGRYALTARVVTVQEGQGFLVQANEGSKPVEIAVPYTVGLWKPTQPVVLPLAAGRNVLHVTVRDGSRGVTIKDFSLTPVP